MNKQILQKLNITEKDYLTWCKNNKKPSYKREIKEEFFKKILDGKIIKNENGELKEIYC